MNDRSDFEQFLKDIAPFFYRRPVIYVDVGAFDGRTFRRVLRSELTVNEAHLVEPNERYLAAARAVGAEVFRGRSVDYYHLALGARSGRIRLHESRSMTRVVGAVDDPDGKPGHGENYFEVDCTTLDELSQRFTERRISLLKVDVEGYELEVLAGARKLLEDQKIDVLYIEAGMNPEGSQQIYYRRIEDELAGHGYRVFKIYEQKNEWLEDSPVLRRTNMCFFSTKFAQSNPYRVTRELYEANRELEKLRRDADAAAERTASLEGEAKEKGKRLAVVEKELARATEAKDALNSKVNALQRTLDIQQGMLESMRASKQSAEKNLYDAFDCMSKLHGRELYARGDALAARAESARIRESFSYRLGAILVTHGRSPTGWLKAPLAILREFVRNRRRRSAGTPRIAAEEIPPMVLSTARSLWVPLTKRPQSVLAKCAEGEWDVWATACSAREGASVTIAMQTSQQGHAAVPGAVDQHQRHRELVIRRLKLKSGEPTRLVEKADGEVLLKLVRETGRFSVLKVSLLPAGAQHDESTEQAAPGAESAPVPAAVAAAGRAEISGSPGVVKVGETIDPVSGESQGRPARFTAEELESKMWGGFAEYAIPELEQVRNDARSLSERRDAAWALTRWFYVEEDFDRALDNIAFAHELTGKPQAHFLLAQGQCLVKQRRYEEADAVLSQGMERYERPDFQLLRSTVARYRALEQGSSPAQAEAAQLEMLNGLFTAVEVAPIRKIREQEPLHLSNITADARPGPRRQDLKVSVVIPAYNAEDTLEWVIGSLLQQTWRNLEVIVVDDCSTDGTRDLVDRIASRDDRVRLIRQAQNGGAYTARNAGLDHASGDLITVHDSDDWSHPQRLELQVDALESDPSVIATKSHWVRVSESLDVIGAWIPKGTLIDLNFSSLLFRREMLEVLGRWDEVLVSGDAEFYARLKRIYGAAAVVKLPRQKLLAFSLTRESSLTRSKATHLRSLYYGLRGNYRDSYLHWHSRLGDRPEDLPFDASRKPRCFPVPPKNLPPGRQPDGKYDVVVISDLAMRGGAFVSTLNYIIAACRAGKKTAVFHWRRYDLARDVSLQARLYEACVEFDIDILSPGDSVDAEVVLIGYPTILKHKIDPMPEIRTKQLLVIVNQFASRLVGGQDQQYDPERVRQHLTDIFGTEGVWLPISAWVRRLMEEDQRYPAPWPLPWYPMIDVDTWCTEPVQWRGDARYAPVIGRHGRDTYTKWPSTADALAQAYGVGQDWEVRFLGGAQHATGMLGGRPANWTIIPFDDMTAEDFLRDLDFYVHYPHEKYIEEFGRGVMEAMAFGIPVVLPPQFKETFGSAATYARPDEVPKVISELWRSRERYLERANAGRSFVLKYCSLSAFPDRLAALSDGKEFATPPADSSTAAGG